MARNVGQLLIGLKWVTVGTLDLIYQRSKRTGQCYSESFERGSEPLESLCGQEEKALTV